MHFDLQELSLSEENRPVVPKMALTWKIRCASWGILSSVVAAVLLTYCWSSGSHLALRMISGALAIPITISSLIAFHISSLRCSESHTLRSLLLSYKFHEGERLATPLIMAKANRMWRRAREAQEKLIRELTRRHAKTEYGRQNRLGEIRCVEDLREKHPLTTYEHFKEYIQRLADGEEGVFLDERPVRFGITWETTGVAKIIPYAPFWFSGDAFRIKLRRLSIYRGGSWPSPVQKRCLLYTHEATITKAGFKVASYCADFGAGEGHHIRCSEHSSHPPAFTISDDFASTYVHMLFAIVDRSLGLLSAIFTTQLYRSLKLVETDWQTMLEDLSTGRINSKIPLSPDVRRSLEGYMRPNPDRVSQLRKEFEKGFDGIVKRIWPHLVAIEGIDIAGVRKRLQDQYAQGVPLASAMFGSTEAGLFGINLWINEDNPRYELLPHMAVYEFIPLEYTSGQQPKTLTVDEVEAGRKYELVMTTRTGLYRYRSGDIIEVVGFYENCPVIRMQYRIGVFLNLVSERTSMQIVATAVNVTMKHWPGLKLVDWTCAESTLYDTKTSELYYVLFVEVESGEKELHVTEEQRSKFDESLQAHHDTYKQFRRTSWLSAARMHFVRPGTFKELRKFTVSCTTTSINQCQTPRKLRTREYVEWIVERVIEAEGVPE